MWHFEYVAHDERLNRIERSLHQSHAQEQEIMDAITNFGAAQTASNAKIVEALDAIATGVAALKAQIASMQTAPVVLSAEDQATLDGASAAAQALVDKAQAVAGAVTP